MNDLPSITEMARVLPFNWRSVVNDAIPQSPEQFGAQLFAQKWGAEIDPRTTLLITLNYDYAGHPPKNGVHQGRIARSRTLLQALLEDYQTVGDGRFAENAFGLYVPPDVGPRVQIVARVDALAQPGSGNHLTYEGIYRQTAAQTFDPTTQVSLRPDDFKRWVWELELKKKYQAYLDRVWPADTTIVARQAYPLRTAVKAAFVMSAWLQRQEGSLSQKGLEQVLQVAGLPNEQAWSLLSLESLQSSPTMPDSICAGRLQLYGYTSTDIWTFRQHSGSGILCYVTGNSSPWHEFTDIVVLRRWVVEQARSDKTSQALASHFVEADRADGTFHAGVLTALEGMARYPKIHWLSKTAGFFNNDGYWDPAEYISVEHVPAVTDVFAQLVLSMKRAAQVSVASIRDDAQVNRDNLSGAVEPLVQWINRFAPLALFVPGGEGVLALAGLIDAGYGLDEAVSGETLNERSRGRARTIFGLLNALPLVTTAAHISENLETPEPPAVAPPKPIVVASTTRAQLLRGIGPAVDGFSDATLAQIARVSAIDDDMLRTMNAGRPPTPMLADTLIRFRLDQELASLTGAKRVAEFDRRYGSLQVSDNVWVRLFQQQYPGLPKNVVEQILDRYRVDLTSTPEALEVRRLFSRIDGKAHQFQQHLRLNRAYEGFYLRSVNNPETDTLALHSLGKLPGWPKDLRIEVLENKPDGRVLDRFGPLEATRVRRLIKTPTQGYMRDLGERPADFYAALLGLLSDSERTALQVTSVDSLKQRIIDNALSRTELMAGLGRMDSGLPFTPWGLRGGGFPPTPEGAALSAQMLRLQVLDLYPGFTSAEVEQWLLQAGADVQAHIDHLVTEFQQLCTDMTGYIHSASRDADALDVDFLAVGDPAAVGMTPGQIQQENIVRLRHAIEYEQQTRSELAYELLSTWQKRPPTANHLYENGVLAGYKINLDFEAHHRLPVTNVRFNDVVELSMAGFHLEETLTLNGFLESFPRLKVLNLEQLDLRPPSATGAATIGVMPPAIRQLTQLRKLNLKHTFLRLDVTPTALDGLVNLQSLDLSENFLGVTPTFLGLNQLREVSLRRTGITTCPVGIRNEPFFTRLDLRDNQISRVPPAVINQAVAPDIVKLRGNPLADEDTLRRLIIHRQQTGINLWLSGIGPGHGEAVAWLRDIDPPGQQARLAIWQRVKARTSGDRFLRVLDGVSLTPDYRVNYADIQARVWQLLNEADRSDALWAQLSQRVEVAEDDADNPMAIFAVLESRVQRFREVAVLP